VTCDLLSVESVSHRPAQPSSAIIITQSAVHTASVDQSNPCNLQGFVRSPAKFACKNFPAAASDRRRPGDCPATQEARSTSRSTADSDCRDHRSAALRTRGRTRPTILLAVRSARSSRPTAGRSRPPLTAIAAARAATPWRWRWCGSSSSSSNSRPWTLGCTFGPPPLRCDRWQRRPPRAWRRMRI
jgi:hypothetical protein